MSIIYIKVTQDGKKQLRIKANQVVYEVVDARIPISSKIKENNQGRSSSTLNKSSKLGAIFDE